MALARPPPDYFKLLALDPPRRTRAACGPKLRPLGDTNHVAPTAAELAMQGLRRTSLPPALLKPLPLHSAVLSPAANAADANATDADAAAAVVVGEESVGEEQSQR